MNLEHLAKQLAFIHEIDKLKYIQRKTRLFNSERNENDAEHSWHLAMMAMVLAEHANEKVDIQKVVKMLLIHDIVEIDSGDIFYMIRPQIIPILKKKGKLQKEFSVFYQHNRKKNLFPSGKNLKQGKPRRPGLQNRWTD